MVNLFCKDNAKTQLVNLVINKHNTETYVLQEEIMYRLNKYQ